MILNFKEGKQVGHAEEIENHKKAVAVYVNIYYTWHTSGVSFTSHVL